MCVNLKSFWKPKKLKEENIDGKRVYRAHVDPPTDGTWVAYFIDIVYAKDKKDALLPIIDILPGFIPRDIRQRVSSNEVQMGLFIYTVGILFPTE
jgi:hypothetical protein